MAARGREEVSRKAGASAARGVALLLLCAATACGEGQGTSGAASGAAEGAASEPPAARFELSISNRTVKSPETLRVVQGQLVELVWTSDQPVTVHVHGYDLEFEVEPGMSRSQTFIAEVTGRFPVTVHGLREAAEAAHADHPHTPDSHELTLVYLEVHPG